MSEKVIVSKEKLTAIAENIRTQTKTTNLVTLDEMATMKLGTDTSNATATSDDILLGKTAYANDTELVGTIETYDGSSEGATNIDSEEYERIKTYGNLKPYLDMKKTTANFFANLKKITSLDNYLKYEDTENVTNMYYMFASCSSLTTIPQLDTSKVTNMNSTFYYCNSLTTIPALNVSKVTDFNNTFGVCQSLKSILMFGMKVNLSLSSSSLLEEQALVTVGSNCQVVTTSQTLTMGTTLLAKVENTYVKKTGVELYEGITCNPCVICESTDEGAMLFTDYMSEKGWTLA